MIIMVQNIDFEVDIVFFSVDWSGNKDIFVDFYDIFIFVNDIVNIIIIIFFVKK